MNQIEVGENQSNPIRRKTKEILRQQANITDSETGGGFRQSYQDSDLEKSESELKQKYGEVSYDAYVQELRKVKKEEKNLDLILENINKGQFELSQFNNVPDRLKSIVAKSVIRNKEKLGINDLSLVSTLIENGLQSSIMRYIDMFDDKMHQQILDKLIAGKSIYGLLFKLDNFKEIDRQKAINSLIETGRTLEVLSAIDAIKGVSHQLIVDKIVEQGDTYFLFRYLDKLQDVDYQKLADQLLKKDPLRLLDNLDKLKGVDSRKLVHYLLLNKPFVLLKNLDRLKGIDYNKTVIDLFKHADPNIVLLNLESLKVNRELLDGLLGNTFDPYIGRELFKYAKEHKLKISLKFKAKFSAIMMIDKI